MSDTTPFGIPMVEELLSTSFLKPLLGTAAVPPPPQADALQCLHPGVDPGSGNDKYELVLLL